MKIDRRDALGLVLQVVGFREEKAGSWKHASFSLDDLIELQDLLRDSKIQELFEKKNCLPC